MRRKVRSGYTLLEVLLALAIAVMLLIAVYSVIGYQLRQAQAGRDLVEQAALARAILNKMERDVVSTLSLGDPARYRRPPPPAPISDETSGMSGMGGGASGMSGMGGASGGMSGTSTGNMSSTTSSSSGMTEEIVMQSTVTLPLGVIGYDSELHLFTSKYPVELFTGDGGMLVSDQRRISYWINEGGLYRAELRQVTSEEGASTNLPSDNLDQYLLAPEVRSLEISYFDGASWSNSWNSTEPGPDGKTPLGSPRAIKIRLGLPRRPGSEDLKFHTHMILIPTAGAAPPSSVPETAEEAATSTSPP